MKFYGAKPLCYPADLMDENPNGDWVRADEALQAIAKLKAENKRLRRKVGQLKADYNSLLGVSADSLLGA